MSDFYKLQYNGMTLAYPGWNGYVGYEDAPAFHTLTLQTDGHGTLSAETLTGYEGDTIILSPTYNTYYRFSGYDCTGGTIAGNTFTFGNQDATAQANFKVNAFTATGNIVTGGTSKNGLLRAFTGDKPSNWPAVGGNWNVTNASAYGITAAASFTGGGSRANAGSYSNSVSISIAGSTKASNSRNNNAREYSFTISTTMAKNTTQGQISFAGSNGGRYANGGNLTNGTWSATGYAP